MILLQTLQLNNFLSHENTTINFQETEKLLVDGNSGSGKSSITEAILWGLYGKGRGDNRSLIRRGSKNASVTIKLNDGQNIITCITRSVSEKGKNTLVITRNTGREGQFLPIERTGIKDTQDWIEKELLRASYELFTNSVAYPQDNENSFVKATASKRKDLLLEIVRAGNFDELYEKAKESLKEKDLQSGIALSKIESLEQSLKKDEEVADTYTVSKTALDMLTIEIESYNTIEKALETQLSSASQVTKGIQDKKTIKQILEKSILTLDEEKKTNTEKIYDHENFDISIHNKNVEESMMLEKQVSDIERLIEANSTAQQKINSHLSNRPNLFDYTAEIDEINKRLISLLKETDKCPAGDKCPFLIPVKGQIDFLTSQIQEKTDNSLAQEQAFRDWEIRGKMLPQVKDTSEVYGQLRQIKDKISVLSKSKDVIIKFNIIKDSINDLKLRNATIDTEIGTTLVKISVIDNEIRELEDSIKDFDINKINIDLSNIRISLQKALVSKQDAAVSVQMALRAKESIIGTKSAVTEIKASIASLIEEKEAVELLKEALSPRGVKAVVIDYLVPQLEERINVVLGQMSDFRIRLDTQKATADEEGVKEGLFITVLNDKGEELPFTSYSGGEKVKITIAISEALASLMSDVGFRIMDENIVSLDKDSTEGFVVVLQKLQEKFPQLLLISHLQEVKDLFEKKMTVIKINGISKVK